MTDAARKVDAIYRAESRRVLATLIRLLGDFDLAEEALHDAFIAAAEQWPREGVPANPRAWLVSAGRFKAIDRLRRRARFDDIARDAALMPEEAVDAEEPGAIVDDQLRLIFTCCHPALAPDSQAALTLREVCGLTTEEIAHAYLSPAPRIAQRIVRAKNKIREAKIPYEIPEAADLPARLESVLHVIYLVFNEGYAASAGPDVTRVALSSEAIRLGRLLVELLRDPECVGLLALMLLQESRRAARSDRNGDIVLLADQDRRLWDRALIAEGTALATEAMAAPSVGEYAIQAAIAAEHSTDGVAWSKVVALYDLLLRAAPSPIVALNRAVAVAMRDGPAAGLALVDSIMADGALLDFHLAHATRADLLRRMGHRSAARDAYEKALTLSDQEPERRFIAKRLQELANPE
jgi:RNA polymerase sigma-70 factor (ECF subfamily)